MLVVYVTALPQGHLSRDTVTNFTGGRLILKISLHITRD